MTACSSAVAHGAVCVAPFSSPKRHAFRSARNADSRECAFFDCKHRVSFGVAPALRSPAATIGSRDANRTIRSNELAMCVGSPGEPTSPTNACVACTFCANRETRAARPAKPGANRSIASASTHASRALPDGVKEVASTVSRSDAGGEELGEAAEFFDCFPVPPVFEFAEIPPLVVPASSLAATFSCARSLASAGARPARAGAPL
mmetsp:Transcript_10498/g.38918  ORF Transcript_10498/g.38918 Transcript_10498/m.38918 type:complete len:205 (-) Transcript_10498:2304-2918(-)